LQWFEFQLGLSGHTTCHTAVGTACLLWRLGSKQLRATALLLLAEHSDVAWFLIAFSFWEAATSSLVALSTSFLIFELGFTAIQVVRFFVLVILVAAPSSVLSKRVVVRYGIRNTLLFALVYSFFVFGALALFCETQGQAIVFALLIGFQSGLLMPLQRFAFSAIIPGGRETELFGLFAFMGQVLGWLPPLVFIVVNQSRGSSLRLALIMPVAFYAIGLAVTVAKVDFARALAAAGSTLALRTGPAFSSPRISPRGYSGEGEDISLAPSSFSSSSSSSSSFPSISSNAVKTIELGPMRKKDRACNFKHQANSTGI